MEASLPVEVNGVAAWQGLQRVTPVRIARAMVDDLLDRKLALARRAAWGAPAASTGIASIA